MAEQKVVATHYDDSGNVTKTVTTITETPDKPEQGTGMYL